MPQFDNGSLVAWNLLDGRTMTGIVESSLGASYYVKRIDGTLVRIDGAKLRAGNYDDVIAAARFYRDIGR